MITPANDRQIELMKQFWKETPDNRSPEKFNIKLIKQDFLSLITRLEQEIKK